MTASPVVPRHPQGWLAQVPAFGKIRQQQHQRKLSTREKVKYEYRMMTTAFSGRLPIVAADPAEAKVRHAHQYWPHAHHLQLAASHPVDALGRKCCAAETLLAAKNNKLFWASQARHSCCPQLQARAGEH